MVRVKKKKNAVSDPENVQRRMRMSASEKTAEGRSLSDSLRPVRSKRSFIYSTWF